MNIRGIRREFATAKAYAHNILNEIEDMKELCEEGKFGVADLYTGNLLINRIPELQAVLELLCSEIKCQAIKKGQL